MERDTDLDRSWYLQCFDRKDKAASTT